MKTELTKPVAVIPLGDRIVVRRLKEKEVTRGGIYIAEVAKQKPSFGVVVAAGEKVNNPYLAGLRVVITFGKYSGTEIEVDGESLLMMREEEVTALVADKSLIAELLSEGA